MTTRIVRTCGASLALVLLAAPAAAQSRLPPFWEIPGFDFRPDGVWRVRARRVTAQRRALLAQDRMFDLNAALVYGAAAPSQTAVTGTLAVPLILFSYPGVDSAQFMRDTSQYSARLFAVTPSGGVPYTLNSYYRQMSNDLFGIEGKVSGWVRLSKQEIEYTGAPSGTCALRNPSGARNCNGVFSIDAETRMQNALREALAAVDATIDFSQFDNDGPDGIPNSSDDDGLVDLALFAHATQDGFCGLGALNNHIWAHRWRLSARGSRFTTNDPRPGGGSVQVEDYLVQSALGGTGLCDANSIMPIGVVAHELGHGLGLPDLYDVRSGFLGPTAGIGVWGLMGISVFGFSPQRMEAWSLSELGWVTIAALTASGVYRFNAAPLADTTFMVRVQGANPRGEYYLLENRQSSLADTALIRRVCNLSGNPPGCGGGLLVWHIDSAKIAVDYFGNAVNNGAIHGVALAQADGFGNLEGPYRTGPYCPPNPIDDTCANDGDAGDPFGETSGKTALVYRTNPAARKNVDSSFAGFAVDQVTQVSPMSSGGEMSFRLRFGAVTVVRASDTAAVIQFQGSNFNVFRDLLEDGTSYTVGVASPQLSADGRTRWSFASWSDGGAQTHDIIGSVAGGTLTANVSREFKLIATAAPGGTVTSNPSVDLSGTFLLESSNIELTATPDGGETFGGWSGDASSADPVIALTMNRPYTVFACFETVSIASPSPLPAGVMGGAYDQTLSVSCGAASNWAVTAGGLPVGMTLGAATGRVSGLPRQTGTFAFTVAATVGPQTVSKPFTLTVSAPALATADVVAHLLGPGTPLTADELRYLDFLGNNNGAFDIGDFLAWVKATGAP